ncbi:MAG: hypothetical protein L0Z55_08010 [Planctomycetes bacterium]|nr:hypothetical protein [Planctomycetota bacterium]
MKKIAWHLEYRKAAAAAREKYLPLLIYFTRSDRDWPPSEEVESGALVSDWWVAASERFVPYVFIDSGLPHPDQALQKSMGAKIPPYFVFVDNVGERVNGFWMNDQEDLERGLGEVEELMAARKAVKEEGGSKVAKARLALIEGMRKSEFDMATLAKYAETPGLDPELVARFERFRNAVPVKEVLDRMGRELGRERDTGGAGNSPRVEAIHRNAEAEIYKLYKRGIRIKTKSEESFERFWFMAFRGAVDAKDRPAAEDAFQVYERAFSTEQSQKRTLDEMREALAKLK